MTTAIHGLDLPNLNLKPGISVLRSTLELIAKKPTNDFEDDDDSEDESQNDPVIDVAGAFRWLTMLVGSPLDWIEEKQTREEVWALASTRMAERCGRMAAPTQTRDIRISGGDDDLQVKIVEPSLTSDSLGLKIWGSSYVLSKRVIRDRDFLKGDILELGSGTGLFGIVAAKLGYDMYLTDLPEIVDNMRKNVEMNGDEVVSVDVLDWNEPEKFEYNGKGFDTVVVADPIYSVEHPKLVADMVSRFLKHDKESQLVIQFPQRPKYQDLRDEFYSLLSKLGLTEIRREVEAGRDEFGQMNYEFSIWKFSL